MESNSTSNNFDSDSNNSNNADNTFVNIPDISPPVSFEEPDSPVNCNPVPIKRIISGYKSRVLPSAILLQ